MSGWKRYVKTVGFDLFDLRSELKHFVFFFL